MSGLFCWFVTLSEVSELVGGWVGGWEGVMGFFSAVSVSRGAIELCSPVQFIATSGFNGLLEKPW